MAGAHCPEDAHPRRLEPLGEAQGRLSTQLHHHPERPLQLHDFEDVLEGQRLEVELVRDVEVGGHRLGVVVGHDGRLALLPDALHGVDAAVVELDALADAYRAGADY